MTESRPKRIALLLLCIALSTFWSYEIRRHFQGPLKMPDFAELYYGAHCAVRRLDPYQPAVVIREFRAENPRLRPDPFAAETARVDLAIDVNVPTSLLLVAPISLLPWPVAQNVWMMIGALVLTLAAYLMWDLARDRAPLISGALAALVLVNCEVLLTVGNMAGIAIALALIAAWCFLNDRFAVAGGILFAISLGLKPHDTGLVWLYFLLAGGILRKRALQTLIPVAVLGVLAVLWIVPASPHWLQEIRRNDAQFVTTGTSVNGPEISAATNRSADAVIDLQAAISIFNNDPHFYNPLSFLVGGALILTWAIAVLRKRFPAQGAMLALAAISALSLLPLYHRAHDAKILLLAIPACALLWTGKGARRWIAVLLTSAAILVTSDLPMLLLTIVTRGLPGSPSTLSAKLLDLVLLEPAPLILLATGCFYLWAFARCDPAQLEPTPADRDTSTIQLESAR